MNLGVKMNNEKKVNDTTYKCDICDQSSSQKSHHDKHIKTEKHITNKKLEKLNLQIMNKNKLEKQYNTSDIDDIISKKETIKVKNNIPNVMITNKYILKDWIHDIHNFLRNNGAGYGMKSLKIFSLFYGLMRLEEFEMLEQFNLTEDYVKFSYLLELANKNDYATLKNVIADREKGKDGKGDSIIGLLFDQPGLKETLYHEIPKHITGKIYCELIKKINQISVIEKSGNFQLAGKVYEYFIGRDESAISELGAFFTDRPIPKLVFDKLYRVDRLINSVNDEVPTFIDPFGGSGGFLLEYINAINNKLEKITEQKNIAKFWKKNINNLNHYDANEDVIKIAGLETMCLTKQKISLKKTTNSFTFDFNNQNYKVVFSNPPYGGDKFRTDLIKRENTLLKEINNILKNDKQNDKLLEQKKIIQNKINEVKQNHENYVRVSLSNSSKRIKKYAQTHNLIATCKETVSMILFMDLLDTDGIACIVMKQGFFFDTSEQYVRMRKHLVEKFNITHIIKVPENAFENTNCVTSIIVFRNNGPTKEIEFSDLNVTEHNKNKFSYDSNGYLLIDNMKDDIKNVDTTIIKKVIQADILKNEDYSLDICDYGNFEIKGNEQIATKINILDIIEINHKHTIDTLTHEQLKLTNIGSIEKNKFMKHHSIVLKEKVNRGHVIQTNDMLISTCRPNCSKTRLITDKDINNGYISNVNKCRIKPLLLETYPPIYIYAIMYQIIGEKGKKNEARNNFERMFVKSSMYPTIKLGMCKHIDIYVHKDQNKIKEWSNTLLECYDINMKKFKKKSKELFDELITEFRIYSA